MAATGRGEANFSPATRRLLGFRAGWRCSAPGCPNGTVGPGHASDEHADDGVAAHIRSAALKGPRGRGALSDEELAHPDNGLWCCAIHGREVDTNAGRGYSVETLKQWKAVREDAARRERSGFSTGSGWIDRITVIESPLFEPGSTLRLEKSTLVIGDRPAGRSALLEWLAALGGNDALTRWRSNNPPSPTRLEVHYDAEGRRHRLEFGFNGNNVSYIHDDRVLHSPPSDLSIVYMREEAGRFRREFDDIESISQYLSLDNQTLHNLTQEISRNGPKDLKVLSFREEDANEWGMPEDREKPFTALTVRIHQRLGDQYFRSLSGGESQRVILEFACAQARERSRSAPTLLLLDGGGWSLDDTYLAETADWLLQQPFQTVLVANSVRNFENYEIWKSWGMALVDRKLDERRASIAQ